jgi:hypothetical protein
VPGQIRPVVSVAGDLVVLSVYVSGGEPTVATVKENVTLLHDDEMLVRFLVSSGGGGTVKWVAEQGGYHLPDLNQAAARGNVSFFSHNHGSRQALTAEDDPIDWDVHLPRDRYDGRRGVLLTAKDAEGRILPLN